MEKNKAAPQGLLSMKKETAYTVSPSMALFLHLPLK